ERTAGSPARDAFFPQLARDQGQALPALAAEIGEFAKAGGDGGPLGAERGILGKMLDDVQGQIGAMVEGLMASMGGEAERIYEVGLHANSLLESMAEVVIAWQLLRH